MNVTELVALVAKESAIPEKRVALYARRLREAGLLPQSKGRFYPEVTCEHCARLLVAMLAEEDPQHAASAVQEKYDAENWMARTQVNIIEGTHIADAESPSVHVVVEEWRKYLRAEVMANRFERVTGDQCERIADNHILDDEIGVGSIKLNRLTRPAVNAFRDRLLTSRSEDMTRRTITTLALVNDFAIDRGWANLNNARGIKVRRTSRLKAKPIHSQRKRCSRHHRQLGGAVSDGTCGCRILRTSCFGDLWPEMG